MGKKKKRKKAIKKALNILEAITVGTITTIIAEIILRALGK